MKRLVGIQADVASGTLTKAEAHQQMAQLALQYPVLLNAIGGSGSVDVLRGGGSASGAGGRRRSGSGSGGSSRRDRDRDLDDDSEDDLSMSPPTRSTSKTSGKASRSAEGDGSEDEMPAARARRPMEDPEDEDDDDYYNSISEANVKAKQDGFGKLSMKLPSMKGRMCGTVADNGVDVPDNEEPADPDACVIM
jgi:hypothetical protein